MRSGACRALLLAAVLLLFLHGGMAKKAGKRVPQPSEVKGVLERDNGVWYVVDKTENKDQWRIVPSDKEPDFGFFFYNERTGDTQWSDPRTPEDDGKTIVEISEGSMIRKKITYTLDDNLDPIKHEEILSEQKMDNNQFLDRLKQNPEIKGALASSKGGLSTTMVVMIPLMLFLGGLAARIWYLHTYYPELLFPTKERKKKKEKKPWMKPTKQRGKMSQDGKGGRSANS